jgi:hypothetical protein
LTTEKGKKGQFQGKILSEAILHRLNTIRLPTYPGNILHKRVGETIEDAKKGGIEKTQLYT